MLTSLPQQGLLQTHSPPRGCSCWLAGASGTKMSLLKLLVFRRDTGRHGRFPVRLQCSHAFPPVLIKIGCDLFTANTIHWAQAGRNKQQIFQAMISSQEPGAALPALHQHSEQQDLTKEVWCHFSPFTALVHLM